MTAKIWTGLESRGAYLRRLSVVYAVELRQKIVTELYMREMSPKQFHAEFGGGSLSRVTKNFERLEQTGWLRRVRTEGPGGGGAARSRASIAPRSPRSSTPIRGPCCRTRCGLRSAGRCSSS